MNGKTINGFILQRLLGKGGMAEVWYAENEIGKPAAIKILNADLSFNEQIVERFRNEAIVMVKLDHPNIRQVYGYGTIDNRPAIIMEYLEGDDLKALMKQGRHFTDEELKQWWNQMVAALNYTHAQSIVHRDIKPSNIFIDKKGDVKLLDFGIAKISDSSSGTLTGSTLGTRIYMSPEQVKDPKRIDYRTDIYSLAVTFVHLLSGKAPYDSTTSSDFEIQLSIVTKPLDLSVVPASWCAFLAPFLEKDPKKRAALRVFSAQSAGSQQVSSDDDLVVTVNGVSFVMKRIEGGTFWMGAHNRCVQRGNAYTPDTSIPNYDANAEPDELPVHQVQLSLFYMGETLVTQALWKAVTGLLPSHWRGDNLPVESVSWMECQDFIGKLNQLTGKKFRMPTEAEWEYAARGGRKGRGCRFAGSNNIQEVACYAANSKSAGTFQVKSMHPNELGLYDMSGNVWEWCGDWYGNYRGEPQVNPVGPAYGTMRVMRGGGWYFNSIDCRVSDRFYGSPVIKNFSIGFRLCLSQM